MAYDPRLSGSDCTEPWKPWFYIPYLIMNVNMSILLDYLLCVIFLSLLLDFKLPEW